MGTVDIVHFVMGRFGSEKSIDYHLKYCTGTGQPAQCGATQMPNQKWRKNMDKCPQIARQF